jgi:energy-coupling factor transporter transmembrane protein EcfT
LISRKSIIQILAASALLIGVRLAIDFIAAAAYVYPEYDFGQFWLAFLIFIVSLILVFVVAIRRLFQKRIFESIAFFAILVGPFAFNKVVDEHYWKFRLHRSEYQSAIQADSAPSPKYRVFNWGNRNTHLVGGGFIAEAIVYDESDEVARPPEEWSLEWLQQRSNSSKDDLWITQIPKSNPRCKRNTNVFDRHYYFVSEEC